MRNAIYILGLLLTTLALANDSTVLTCEPQTLHGIPGEPLQTMLTIESSHTQPALLSIPAASNIVLRTIEKIPLQRTRAGRYIQKRLIIWQGTEAGTTTLTNLTVTLGHDQTCFPPIQITIAPVEIAMPPQKEAAK